MYTWERLIRRVWQINRISTSFWNCWNRLMVIVFEVMCVLMGVIDE